LLTAEGAPRGPQARTDVVVEERNSNPLFVHPHVRVKQTHEGTPAPEQKDMDIVP
jgi:hypothetical protein